MFDTIHGIPMHPLVVHGVVVLLPLAILGTVAIAVRPAWRVTYGPLVLACEVIVTALCPVATASGEKFEARVIPSGVGRHSELGDQLVFFSAALLIFTAALLYVDHRARREPSEPAQPRATAGSRGAAALPNVMAVLAIVAAIAAAQQVYRVGDSGAKAAWGYAGKIQPK